MNPGMKKPLRASLFTVFFHSPAFQASLRLAHTGLLHSHIPWHQAGREVFRFAENVTRHFVPRDPGWGALQRKSL